MKKAELIIAVHSTVTSPKEEVVQFLSCLKMTLLADRHHWFPGSCLGTQ
ncbi:hypothetical protein Pla52n_16280 [Stieleria varia]|uniref:Uncharacterized protein n=1 Tax=Stieleria varia TaxID=2528005 RepID=A0A5C6B330_9BACT|nr:hypothetical protein Pla52n_16280 [Stieleria varia]